MEGLSAMTMSRRRGSCNLFVGHHLPYPRQLLSVEPKRGAGDQKRLHSFSSSKVDCWCTELNWKCSVCQMGNVYETFQNYPSHFPFLDRFTSKPLLTVSLNLVLP